MNERRKTKESEKDKKKLDIPKSKLVIMIKKMKI